MRNFSLQINDLESAFESTVGAVVTLSHCERLLATPSWGTVTLDKFPNGISCHFVSVDSDSETQKITLWVDGEYRLEKAAAGGWLLVPAMQEKPFLWVPSPPTQRVVEENGRILRESEASPASLHVTPNRPTATFIQHHNWRFDVTVWYLPETVVDELRQSAPFETAPIELWGSHTQYEKPADLYIHLVSGWIYENRYAWPHNRRICSENDAHALYVALSALHQSSGKAIYRLLKLQTVLAVIARQSEDGSWRHGEWTDHMERHFRLHCSAMHLLMDYLAEEKDETTRSTLARAAAFISQQHDQLNCGIWFLHDELEKSAQGMAEAPFRSLKNNAFGKSESNMLVLNTQLDTSIALHRYARLTGDPTYRKLVSSAAQATRTVLSARPADWLYRPLLNAIALTLIPTRVAKTLPLPVRAFKRIAWKYLVPLLPYMKQHFPRLVFPGGYIDREVSLDLFANVYLSINLMDLLRYYRETGERMALDVALDGIRFGQRLRIWERWLELPNKAYACGFWTEALYHLCLLDPKDRHFYWLFRSVLVLEGHARGISPSLFGTNCEAISSDQQLPIRYPSLDGIRIINLSAGNSYRILMINTTESDLTLPRELFSEMGAIDWSLAPFDTVLPGKPEKLLAETCLKISSQFVEDRQ